MTLESSLDKLLNTSEVFGQASVELINQNHPSMKTTIEEEQSQPISVSDYLVAFTTQSHSFCEGGVKDEETSEDFWYKKKQSGVKKLANTKTP